MYARSYIRRISLLAALIYVGHASPALAADKEMPPKNEEGVEIVEGPVEFLFGEPGQLTIDASEGKAVLPTLIEPLKFKDWRQFGSFLKEVFNARVEHGDAERPPLVDLRYTVIGAPLYVDPETETVYQVDDPIAEFIGGPDGWIYVNGAPYCFNLRLCGEEAGYEPEAAGGRASLQSLSPLYTPRPGLRPLLPPIFGSLQIAGESGVSEFLFDPGNVLMPVHWHYWSRTDQIAGGYMRRLEGVLEWVRVCREMGDINTVVCVGEPRLVFRVVGENVLTATMRAVDYDYERRCFRERAYEVESAPNVTSVTAGHIFIYLDSPNGIIGKHTGWDSYWGTFEEDVSYWGTGSNPASSCR